MFHVCVSLVCLTGYCEHSFYTRGLVSVVILLENRLILRAREGTALDLVTAHRHGIFF